MRSSLDRRLVAFALLLLASGAAIGLLWARRRLGGGDDLDLLAWNLFLAWLPFVIALVIYDRQRRGQGLSGLVMLAALWLVFFPNAPYIATDFVHVGNSQQVPAWYDAATVAAFAGLGLVLGFASLILVQSAVRARWGTAWAWSTALVALALAAAGVYIGRVVRLNSWDVLVNPGDVAQTLLQPLGNPVGHLDALAIVSAVAAGLVLAYLLTYALSALVRASDDGR